jgi:uncharacterized protein YyaL (SSP411 family)
MPNRLINETSPYLLQHAHNPVDWYPWGPEALERARAEDRPILLSVGYSSCHWCHVMEEESFENPDIAQLMNENFVCIKVDREERPDIDSIYMTAVQAMTGRGGWPMTVFLTPDGKPFYGGTYYPPEDRHGIPGFPRVLQAIARAYREDRADVARATQQLVQHMRQVSAAGRSLDPLTADVLHQAYRGIAANFDGRYGGVGMQPKFPQPMTYEFLLRYHLRFQSPQALQMVELTLDRMAQGGIYDQLGGGFHRYSTDTFWLVPHFEKMLYDNALLAKLYLHAFQVTGKPLYRRIVEETLGYVLREMADPLGGFYSAQDADSEGVEGKFFIWRPEEIIEALGREEGEIFNRYYGVTREGNFEGRSVLHVAADAATLAGELGMTEEELDATLRRARERLLEVRERRIHPGRDEKILTAWNGLMLRAFAEAAAVLKTPLSSPLAKGGPPLSSPLSKGGPPLSSPLSKGGIKGGYAEVAERNAAFLLDNLRQNGRLLRTYKASPERSRRDGQARLKGYLEDYSFLIDGLLALHEATFNARWLQEAIALGQDMVELFWDEASGQFYDTGRDHEELIVRPRDLSDNATPAGSSMATDVLLRLAVITGDAEGQRRALAALRSVRELMARFPTGTGHWLSALDFYLSTPREIAIIGDRADPATQALAAEVYRRYIPNRVLVGQSDGEDALSGLPLLEGREQVNGRPTAYVCQNYICQLPVNEPEELAKQLVS